MIENDTDEFLDLLGEKLVGSCLLMNIDYNVVGLGGDDELLFEVTGDVTMVLNGDDNDKDDDYDNDEE